MIMCTGQHSYSFNQTSTSTRACTGFKHATPTIKENSNPQRRYNGRGGAQPLRAACSGVAWVLNYDTYPAQSICNEAPESSSKESAFNAAATSFPSLSGYLDRTFLPPPTTNDTRNISLPHVLQRCSINRESTTVRKGGEGGDCENAMYVCTQVRKGSTLSRGDHASHIIIFSRCSPPRAAAHPQSMAW